MTGKTPRKMGARTVLTEEVKDRVTQAIRAGNYLDDAANFAGIAKSTVMYWNSIGRDARNKLDNGEEITEREAQCLDFLERIERARSEAVVRNLTIIQEAARENWTAAAWYLERTNPKKWGRHDTVAITGEDGGPVQIEHQLSVKEALAEKFRAAELLAAKIIDVDVLDESPQDEAG